ncbi:response regulator [Clostridium sartagoforme]|uniref:Stage 0 sporulation protein A homolog n=1 Tax=Clostridium sartagoforme TaxID=84031 RepID=A0A4S2DKL3_9CLOT|nr:MULTISPECIES: response regulator [Clostridium]MBS5939674.1 response regulator [Clostridium sp.]TGY42769.1 response regulator [Clostridium sartagoforme]
MGLYKLIIVDDEEEIRLGVIKKINWEENGFIVVGDAENGQEALELAERLHPDVIMTDIKMPFMDGLELGKKVIDLMPSTKIIIFSGSDDLDYAHQAIKINVVEYVLKPINSLELVEVLKRLKEKLDKEYDEKRNTDILKKHYLESIPVIREQFLVGALEGRINKEQWKENEKKLGLDFINQYLCVAIINIDGISKEQDSGLVSVSIKNMVDETMQNYCKFISFPYLDKMVVLLSLYEKDNIMKVIKGLNEVCKIFECVFGSTISIGIGRIYKDINEIRFSYRSAQSALGYRQILGNGKTIYIDDLEPDNSIQLKFEDQDEIRFLNSIKLSGEDNIRKTVGSIFKKIEESLVQIEKYRIYLMEVLTSMLKLTQSHNIEVNNIFGDEFNFYTYLDEFNSIEEIKEWFILKAIMLNEIIKKERVNSSKILVEKAKEYIKINYSDYEISVEKLCSNLHVSPTYFSTIFKKETDMSFVNYLTDVRLDEAVKLLNTTDDKTYIIATRVGYQEANYFSYVFKKKFGISPSRYRKN